MSVVHVGVRFAIAVYAAAVDAVDAAAIAFFCCSLLRFCRTAGLMWLSSCVCVCTTCMYVCMYVYTCRWVGECRKFYFHADGHFNFIEFFSSFAALSAAVVAVHTHTHTYWALPVPLCFFIYLQVLTALHKCCTSWHRRTEGPERDRRMRCVRERCRASKAKYGERDTHTATTHQNVAGRPCL